MLEIVGPIIMICYEFCYNSMGSSIESKIVR